MTERFGIASEAMPDPTTNRGGSGRQNERRHQRSFNDRPREDAMQASVATPHSGMRAMAHPTQLLAILPKR
jgi:hypothetical protein